jgi:glycosyltransferase involved in cell wall biosynthesis
MSGTRVLYVQYTNPAAYPPLEQGATQLADAGCDVLFLGARARAVESLHLAMHPRIRCTLFEGDAVRGWRLKWHFIRFTAWIMRQTRQYRPDWVYVSDVMGTPAGWILSTVFGTRVIYHEHDRFEPRGASAFMRLCLTIRRRLARAATVNVLPSDSRIDLLCADTGVPHTSCLRVWNCPSLLHVRPAPAPVQGSELRLLFYGSIAPSRVPLSLLHAMARLPDVSLRVIGFETGVSIGHLDRMRQHARALGVEARLEILGPMSHTALFAHADDCDVGLACMPMDSDDANMRSMAGASNKAFEYLARGLPLLVSPMPDWQAMFVTPGYAIACDIENVDSLVAALRWYSDDPARRQSMGERGRQRVLTEWNYEAQFSPVLQMIVERA